ncbi:MAG: pyridinium-3,5-biscarboxylic acid mononucleotide sulfurtransferase [Clostridia bacterium]|jgi:uncharacterized protein|nr:pyridinium-3,5-biscarboxylic acid mononucleotide sulfurtransferase [Clostridia bacterium]MDN5322583.1 pyridinium-3,5-biscarboxylic acid mononucleotide sulfurtransferase [Clostridia bacterium]
MKHKLNELKNWFKDKNGVLVAFSGGVDSTLLLKVALDVLGDKALAVTANSPLNTPQEKENAVQLAKKLGANHLVVDLNDLENPLVRANPSDRCYHCKKARFEKMLQLAKENDLEVVVEGSNLDDLNDYRPGLKAVKELGVASPLEEIGLPKKEIRQLAKELDLPVWNKPSEPCLATRIPFNTELTLDKLQRVMHGEHFLKIKIKLNQVRVRDHNGLARIEVEQNEIEKAFLKRDIINEKFINLGYKYVTLDLMGYRTGSMN